MRFLGHPLHPPLVHVPLAAWLLIPLADGAAFATGDIFFARAALWLTAIALASALLAAAAGMMDAGGSELDKPSSVLVGAHALVMTGAIILTGLGLLGRMNPEAFGLHPWWPPGAGGATAVLAMIGGWLGGELVHGRGVGRRASG